MLNYSDLTIDQKRKIVFEQVNSMFIIEKDDLKVLIEPDVLSNLFIETAPMILGDISYGTAAALLGNEPSKVLSKMYLLTYHFGGKVKFAYSQTIDKYLIFFNFSVNPSTFFFTKERSSLKIDGCNGLKYLRLIQIHNATETKFDQMTTLNLIIKKNNSIVFNQPLFTMISAYQYFKEYVRISKDFSEFDQLEICIDDSSNSLDYYLTLSYE